MDRQWLSDLRARLTGRRVDLDALLRQIIDQATERMAADRGTLYLVDHARNELVSRVAKLYEIAEIRLRIGEGLAGTVARTGTAIILRDGDDDPRLARRFDETTGYRTRNMLVVPICDASGTVIAVLQLLNKAKGDFDRADQDDLLAIGEGIAELLDATSLRSQLVPELRQPLSFRFNHIVGESAVMQKIYDRTLRAAATDATVLVAGESGTGKELIARAIHDNSGRRDAPFVKVDCAALPESLIENELFGHVRGAFTGADRDSEGKVHAAHGGTLFLDEVGELPSSVQGKLLRLIQDQTFFRVGAQEASQANLRFVAATNRNLAGEVADGQFRQDLFYRLRVVEIALPPLRARGGGDLDRLIDHFVFEFARRHERPGMRLHPDARAELHGHPWPGNVRELENALESAVVMAPGDMITPDCLQLVSEVVNMGSVGFSSPDDLSLEALELRYLRHVIDKHDGNKSQAARVLGIGRNTLNRKLKG